MNETHEQSGRPILVLGANGKTGRRVVERLTARGVPVRAVSRSTDPRFDWEDPDFVGLLEYLFATVGDGRNAHLANGVQRALGREPKDFAGFAATTAATGIWNAPDRGSSS